jgi:4-amino-4-deoxy-L-arabinose transferase-like glycosyltransferase
VPKERDAAVPGQTQHWQLFKSVPFSVEGWPAWSSAEDFAYRERVSDPSLSHVDRGSTGTTADSPPLYYLPNAALARVLADADPVDRLFAMRVTSVVLSCLTVLFMVLFARELLPSEPRAWALAGLAIAFQPVFAFLSGAVLNDNLLFTFATALFWLLARSLRLGLTLRRGVAIGAVLALGELSKTRMVLLAPGVALALILLILRAPTMQTKLRAIRNSVAAATTAICIEGAWILTSRFVLHRKTGVDRVASAAEATSLAGKLSYTWQFFAPRLPFMADQFPRWPQYGLWEVYIQGFVGRFGWFQYGFPPAVNYAGVIALVVIAALAMSTALQRWRSTTRRWPELLVYPGTMAALAVLVAFSGYSYRASTGYNLEQTRYLFPCLALYAGAVALATLGVGRRMAAIVAATMASLFVAHSFFALVLTVTRYYT